MPPVTNQLGYQNFLSGKLTADVTNVATDIFIDTIPSISQGFLVIDPFTPASREVIFFTSKTASKVSVPAVGGRGVNGTALPHFNGTTYVMSAIAEMFAALQNGTASTDPMRTDFFGNNIVSGGVVALSAGLVGTFSNIIFWLAGVRYSGTSIANKTYTASKDTYVDITGNADGSVTVTYTEVANGATAPALTSGYIRIAKVVTSGAAITGVSQVGNADTLGNTIYPVGAILTNKVQVKHRFFAYRNTAWTTNTVGIQILLDTKTVDYGNNFNISNGRFVAPEAGLYHFNASVGFVLGATQGMVLALYVNGANAKTLLNEQFNTPGGWTAQFTGSGEIFLQAGDYVTLFHLGTPASAGATGTPTSLEGYLVSGS